MTEEQTLEQLLLARWLKRSDDMLLDAGHESSSVHTRCSAAFESGYACALYALGPAALRMSDEHPSESVLREAAEFARIDTGPGLLYLKQGLDDPSNMPNLDTMVQWAHRMRMLVRPSAAK
jgi:hypothetical protein